MEVNFHHHKDSPCQGLIRTDIMEESKTVISCCRGQSDRSSEKDVSYDECLNSTLESYKIAKNETQSLHLCIHLIIEFYFL